MVQSRLIVAFALLAAAPAAAASLDAAIGRALFQRNWVSAPSSTKSDDGLGPLYDAPSCAACHLQQPLKDFDETTVPPGTVIRLGNARGTGDPVYGYQLQTRAVAGQKPEANPDIEWMASDGKWTAAITLYSQSYGALASGTKVALRRAPVLNGVGLLAQVPESEILALARTQREKRDGIAGKPSYVTVNGKRVLGRFGWKATEPDVASQISMAFSRDIGLSTTRHPEPWGDCTATERECRAGPHGAEPGEVEVADTLVDEIAAYLNALKAPQPRSQDGARLFARSGCDACHAALHLADGTPVPAFTDMLLHDLGPGLADGIREGAAKSGEWRTAPLWNVAASLEVGRLMHDGRARNVAEAIDWHGGEAAAARNRFRALSPEDRAALVAYVSGL